MAAAASRDAAFRCARTSSNSSCFACVSRSFSLASAASSASHSAPCDQALAEFYDGSALPFAHFLVCYLLPMHIVPNIAPTIMHARQHACLHKSEGPRSDISQNIRGLRDIACFCKLCPTAQLLWHLSYFLVSVGAYSRLGPKPSWPALKTIYKARKV